MSDERTALERRQTPGDSLSSQLDSHRAPGFPDSYNYANNEEDEGPQIDYIRWLRAIFKRKWLIAVIVTAITSLAIFETYRLKESYEAFVVIAIGKENTTLIKSGEMIVHSDETLKTKIFILQSTPLIEDVIIGLNLNQSPDTLGDKKNNLEETFEAIGKTVKRRLYGSDAAKEEMPELIDMPSLQPAIDRHRTPAESWNLEPYVDQFRNRYNVETISDTRLIRISFVHTDPVVAAAVCNRIAELFVQRNFQGKAERMNEASGWLVRSERELKLRIEKAEQSLANYLREHTNIAPMGKGSLNGDKLLRMQGEVTRAETERILKESLFEEARQGRVAQIPEAFADPRIVELQKKLGELSVTDAQLDVNYGPENPQTIEIQRQITTVQKQIDAYRKSLADKLEVDYKRSVRDEESLRSALERAKNESAQENQDTLQYGILLQEVETSKALYRNFVERSNQASFELGQQENNLHVIESARVPRMTFGPQRKLWITIGFVFSLLLGTGIAIILEVFDHSIKDTDDISRQLQLPTLAVIPKIGEKPQLSLREWIRLKQKLLRISNTKSSSSDRLPDVPADDDGATLPVSAHPMSSVALESRTPAAEAYRLLRTSIRLSVEHYGLKTLLITSSQPGEGKTTTTINTAISLAQIGKSVLIIDCDLRTPQVHKELGVYQKPGLSTYLSGNAKLNTVIQRLKILGLSFLSSGPIPDNPAELISSHRMKEMLQALAQRYDHILIDSPPLINLADPVILSTLVDGVLLVVQAGRSNRDNVRRARVELTNAGANILGVVLNNTSSQRMTYYGYYTKPQQNQSP